MEIRYTFVIYIAIIMALILWVLYILKRHGKRDYKEGSRYGDLSLMDENPYFRRQKVIYRIATWTAVFGMLMTIVCAGVLLSRLYTTKRVSEDQYSRDIILCLDISTSVDELNKNLVRELEDTVKQLRGERMGIVIFNTSPVLISPLTDDYEYIQSQLEEIHLSLEERMRYDKTGVWKDDTYEKYMYLQEGTLVGNEERGSSLIGDGLASCVYNFPEESGNRAKVVIFATDNDPYGDGYFTLMDAADLCHDEKIVVYGIGTREMQTADMEEMKTAMESTGGRFFLEDDAGTFSEIVEEIQRLSSGKVKSKSYVKETDMPQIPFVLLLTGVCIWMVALKILRR